jgi:dTDP-4-dehydrorhamnose reductase
MVVLVTGANGQLGQSLRFIAPNYPEIEFVFCDVAELDITNTENCQAIFEQYKPDFCINTAAYTAVDKAESEPEKAHLINVEGAKNLAIACKKHNAILLHISTDFVFDGTKKTPYTEEDIPNPTGVYGQTKLDGEKAIRETWNKHFIIRTAWVYSQFGNNFMKTMLRLASERESLSVVNNQIGTPTNAIDLAEVLIKLITYNLQPTTYNQYGIYNFSNEGQCSWFDFAKEIFRLNDISIDLQPIPTNAYPTPAKRPAYSVLDKKKIKNVFEIEINSWQMSLKIM